MARSGGLLHHRDFRLLLAGQAISEVGSQVTLVALPLVAVVTLHASAFRVGLLAAATKVAFLLLGLPAGVWVDRLRRRSILIVADVVRGVGLATVPVAADDHWEGVRAMNVGDRPADLVEGFLVDGGDGEDVVQVGW